jgi:hypothetical protein
MGCEISSSLSSPESTVRPSNVVFDANVERPMGVPDLLIVNGVEPAACELRSTEYILNAGAKQLIQVANTKYLAQKGLHSIVCF